MCITIVEALYHAYKDILFESACLFVKQRRILLTTGMIWFSFTVKLITGPEKVYNYFREGVLHPPTRNHP